MRLIDVHCHLGVGDHEQELFEVPEEAAFAAWLAAYQPPPGPPGILTAPAYYAYPNGLADSRRLNDLLVAVQHRWPDRFLAVCGTVEPHFGPAGLAEIDRLVTLPSVRGVVWRSRANGVFVDVPIMVEYVRRATERGLVPLVHAQPTSGNEAFWRVRRLAAQLDGAPLLALGALATWDQAERIAAGFDLAPNLYFDTTDIDHGFDSLGPLVRTLGPDRLLFGLGARTRAVAQAQSQASTALAESGLPADVIERIAWRNAAALFRLPLGGGVP